MVCVSLSVIVCLPNLLLELHVPVGGLHVAALPRTTRRVPAVLDRVLRTVPTQNIHTTHRSSSTREGGDESGQAWRIHTQRWVAQPKEPRTQRRKSPISLSTPLPLTTPPPFHVSCPLMFTVRAVVWRSWPTRCRTVPLPPPVAGPPPHSTPHGEYEGPGGSANGHDTIEEKRDEESTRSGVCGKGRREGRDEGGGRKGEERSRQANRPHLEVDI